MVQVLGGVGLGRPDRQSTRHVYARRANEFLKRVLVAVVASLCISTTSLTEGTVAMSRSPTDMTTFDARTMMSMAKASCAEVAAATASSQAMGKSVNAASYSAARVSRSAALSPMIAEASLVEILATLCTTSLAPEYADAKDLVIASETKAKLSCD